MRITAKELSIQDAAGMQLAELIRKLAAEVEESSSGIPDITAGDVGKFLKAGEDGAEWDEVEQSSGVPDIAAGDVGKYLKAGNDGAEWALGDIVIARATVGADLTLDSVSMTSVTMDTHLAQLTTEATNGKIVVILFSGTNDSSLVTIMAPNGTCKVMDPDIIGSSVKIKYVTLFDMMPGVTFGSVMTCNFSTYSPKKWEISYDGSDYSIKDETTGTYRAITLPDVLNIYNESDTDSIIVFRNQGNVTILNKNGFQGADLQETVYYGEYVNSTTKKLICVTLIMNFDLQSQLSYVTHHEAEISSAMWS